MENLRQYSDDELSLRVFNEEPLYLIRHKKRALWEIIECEFSCTRKQEKVLINDLKDDLKEINRQGRIV